MAAPRIAAGAGWLRRDAEAAAGALPPLLIEAERLASTLTLGVHGRRRAGMGETFWQYRAAHPGDSHAAIDWRRSARSDRLYVREMEWEAAETVMIWCDRSRAMDYRSRIVPTTKRARAELLTLALAVLLRRGGERVGLVGTEAQLPRTGERQLQRMALLLSKERDAPVEYGAPPAFQMARGGRAVFFSDFMGPRDAVFPALLAAAGQGVGGVFVQVLDPAEAEFPFAGRTRFESMGRAIRHETDQAGALREAYLERLAERQDDLARTARRAGWQLLIHRTDESPRTPLLALHHRLGSRLR